MENRSWVVYLIRCSDESLYCGITNNLNKRLAVHNSGRGAKYTRSRQPVELIGVSSEMTKSDALKLEYRIKQVSAVKKIIKLTEGKGEITMNLKKELQALNKEIQALTKRVEKLITATGKIEKTKPGTGKAKPAKKVVIKKSPTRKPVKLTAADAVLGMIKRSKKGIDTASLITKTGFNRKKIHNITFKLTKQGKIKSDGKGVYVVA